MSPDSQMMNLDEKEEGTSFHAKNKCPQYTLPAIFCCKTPGSQHG